MKRTIAVLLSGSLAYAITADGQDIDVPHVFEAGTPARASEVNANFSAVIDGINANRMALAELGAGIDSCTEITEPGSYKVTGPIDAAGFETCIAISVNNVVLDLGGFAITGDGMVTHGRAIVGHDLYNIQIRNGTIANFLYGISLFGSENVRVVDMTISDMLDGGVFLGEGASVSDSFFTRCGNDTALTVGRGSIVRDNIFSRNDIAANVGPSSLVLNNVVKDSNQDGLNVAEQSSVIGNTVVDTSDEGLKVRARSNIVNNTLHGNETDLFFDCPSNIVGNSIGRLGHPTTGCTLHDNLIITDY